MWDDQMHTVYTSSKDPFIYPDYSLDVLINLETQQSTGSDDRVSGLVPVERYFAVEDVYVIHVSFVQFLIEMSRKVIYDNPATKVELENIDFSEIIPLWVKDLLRVLAKDSHGTDVTRQALTSLLQRTEMYPEILLREINQNILTSLNANTEEFNEFVQRWWAVVRVVLIRSLGYKNKIQVITLKS